MDFAYLSGTEPFTIVQSLQTAGTFLPIIVVVVFIFSSGLAGKSEHSG
jgi:hypothetical protein